MQDEAGARGEPVEQGPVDEIPDRGEPEDGVVAAGDAGSPAASPVIATLAQGDRVLDVPNEAIPDGPLPTSAAAQGSIPAAHRHRVWSRLQATNWRLFLVRFLTASLAVAITMAVVPGLGFTQWRWGLIATAGLVFGLVNAFVKPLLQFVSLRFILSTYGVIVVAVNVVVLLIVVRLMPGTFEASGVFPVIVGGVVLGLLTVLLEAMLGATPPVLDRDYKERNGLP